MQGNQSRQIADTERDNAHERNFALAVEDHRPQIFRFLLASRRDVDTADALTQECFLKTFRSWSNFRGDSSVATWVTRIAINLQRDHSWTQPKSVSMSLEREPPPKSVPRAGPSATDLERRE
jgi:DNA-directed RNA polymerase specialized sigma24 family protein